MTSEIRPFRSILFIPGSNERALDKAMALPTDGIIFDLEDAVSPYSKDSARDSLCDALRANDYGHRSLLVRVNGFDSEWVLDDLAAVCNTGPEAILLPKVERAADVQRLAAYLDDHPKTQDTAIWAMMESTLGILNAQEIAGASPRLRGFVLGTNDLVKELGARHTMDRANIMTSLSLCLLAARTHGLICIDGVYNAFKDEEGLRQMCLQARDMGFDGKSLLHPAQLAVTNEVFSPSKAEIDLALRQASAFEEAKSQGKGIAVVDGAIVENLHVHTAQKVLAMARAIEAAKDQEI